MKTIIKQITLPDNRTFMYHQIVGLEFDKTMTTVQVKLGSWYYKPINSITPDYIWELFYLPVNSPNDSLNIILDNIPNQLLSMAEWQGGIVEDESIPKPPVIIESIPPQPTPTNILPLVII